MVHRLKLTAAAVAASSIGLIGGPMATAHAATPVNYVALGDSYASGVGAGNYISSSGSCQRSTSAYPALWAAAHNPTSYTSVACSGATTAIVASSQLSALSSTTSLVSITVGGNDEGFATIMQNCVLQGTATCVNNVNAAITDTQANLPAKLGSLYAGIRSHAPNAQVVVVDYPQFYDLNNNCIGLSSASRTAIDHGIDVLDGVLKTAATNAGFAFADARPTFTGHEICDSGSWLHSVNFLKITESYHPTAAGQSGGYLPAFSAAVS